MGITWSDEETAFLKRLKSEAHSLHSVVLMLGRSPSAVQHKCRELEIPGWIVRERNGRKITITVPKDTFRNLEACAKELECSPSWLVRVVLTIIHQRQLWGALLKLGGPHDGPDEIEAE